MNESLVEIRGLKLRTRIGVPDAERAEWQELRVDVEMTPLGTFGEMRDEISATIDYHAVCLEIATLAETGERRLIETLAAEIAEHVLARHAAAGVVVKIRKFILPQTEWVGVTMRRARGDGQ